MLVFNALFYFCKQKQALQEEAQPVLGLSPWATVPALSIWLPGVHDILQVAGLHR